MSGLPISFAFPVHVSLCFIRLSPFFLQAFYAPAIDDKILEVVAVFGTVQMAASRVINLQHHRIAQVTARFSLA